MDYSVRLGRSALAGAARLFGAVLIAATLASCGEPQQQQRREPPQPTPGQTIARVNGQEITTHELEAELKELGPLEAGEQAAVAQEVLRRIIQRTILAQKATEKALQRTPEVMTDLRRREADILARAYVSDNLARQLPISKYDVEDFIEENPHYFARRKHYIFDQVVIGNDQMTDKVMDAIENLTTLEDVEQVLTGMNVAFTRRINANLGSQFPRQTVDSIDALEPGEIFLTETKDKTIVSKVVQSRLQPVADDQARDMAKRLLTARRDATASRKLVEDVTAAASIELLGDYSDMQLFAAEPAAEEHDVEMLVEKDKAGDADKDAGTAPRQAKGQKKQKQQAGTTTPD